MQKKDTYLFPAILSYDDDGISIEFPDLPGCLPCADTTEEAVANARDAMALHLWSMEKDNEPIPSPTGVMDLKLQANEIPLMVDAFMPPVREKQNNRYVKKTLSIPAWLNAEAERRGVNFSHLLQTSLMKLIEA